MFEHNVCIHPASMIAMLEVFSLKGIFVKHVLPSGALLVKKSSEDVLHKTYFGGGTVQVAIAQDNFHVKKTQLEDR